jgi:hypothetical protein
MERPFVADRHDAEIRRGLSCVLEILSMPQGQGISKNEDVRHRHGAGGNHWGSKVALTG